MLIKELLEYMSPEPVRNLEVGTVSGDMNFAGTIDMYVKEER